MIWKNQIFEIKRKDKPKFSNKNQANDDFSLSYELNNDFES